MLEVIAWITMMFGAGMIGGTLPFLFAEFVGRAARKMFMAGIVLYGLSIWLDSQSHYGIFSAQLGAS